MTGFHLSKSEVFFQGALYERLFRFTDEYTAQADRMRKLCQDFPPTTDVLGTEQNPYEIVEAIALECGLARRVELLPAGDDPDSPSPRFGGELPADIQWFLSDGQPATKQETEGLARSLDATTRQAFDTCVQAGVGIDDLGILEQFVDAMNGEQTPVSRNPLERSLYRILDAHGPHMAFGHAASTARFVYYIDWLGEIRRFSVSQQTSPQYCAFLLRFEKYLDLPPLVRLSVAEQLTRSGGSLEEILPVGWPLASTPAAPRTPHKKHEALTAFLASLAHRYNATPEWNLGRAFAHAARSAVVLENLAIGNRDLLADQPQLPYLHLEPSTADRVQALATDLGDWMTLCTEETEKLTSEASPEGLLADSRRRLSINARFLLGTIIEDLRFSVDCAGNAAVPDAEPAIATARSTAVDLKHSFRVWLAGTIDGTAFEAGCRRLSAMTSDAMKLCFGMLYFKELDFGVYIDPETQRTVLRQPKATRALLAEMVSQFEHQTLPNCTVTTAVGLVEPIARQMNQNWNSRATYGTTAETLTELGRCLIKEREAIRRNQQRGTEPSPVERELDAKLYCVDIARGLHHLTNSARHQSDVVLSRHDAGVMLHGLCVLLSRLNQ